MNYWIVSRHDFVLHSDIGKAVAEAERLIAKESVPFHIYRVKQKLTLDGKSATITPALSEIEE